MPREGTLPVDKDTKLANEAQRYLLSITDDLFQGPAQDKILSELRAAPFASLFVLSRTAQSTEVRREAAKILKARLREDASRPSQPPPPAYVPTNGEGTAELPAAVATHRHFYKFFQDGYWVLATRKGIRVATFHTEAQLDHWWRRLKRQRGRILTKVHRDTPPESGLPAQPPESRGESLSLEGQSPCSRDCDATEPSHS